MSFQRFSDQLGGYEREAAPEAQPQPDHIADVLARIDSMEKSRRPSIISERQWFTLLRDLRAFTGDWLTEALRCGWSMLDLYGWHRSIAVRRWDMAGVAVMLDGRQVESIRPECVTILNRLGPPNTFYRQQPGCSVPANRSAGVPIWTAVLSDAERLG